MKTLFLALTLAVAGFGQQLIEGVTYSTDALEASRRFILSQPGQAQATTFASPVQVGDTTYTLTSIGTISVGDQLLSEGDCALVTAVNGAVVTVTRSQLGTTAAAHAQGTAVQQLKYRSIQHLFRQVRITVAQNLLEQLGSQTVDARNAEIAAAKAAIAAARAAAGN